VRRRTLRLRFLSVAGLAAAAVLAVAVFHAWHRPAPASPALVASGPRLVTLADGSRVRMNAGSELAEQFTTVERHVVLTRGEAHFTVVSNPDRPFVVTAGSLRVRAVGTAFNVTVQAARTEVLVTEGKVGLERTYAPPQPRSGSLQLGVNERAVAGAGTRAASDIAITAVPAAEVSRLLAWQESLLRLGGATLGEIAEEFSRRTGRAVLIPDADLAHVRIGGRFRADDVEGFIRLLGTTFEIDVDVEHSPGGALTLRRKSANSRSGN
jgi:transmembrane sensor